MLTTASAIADVNFTEKTYFTSTQLGDGANVYASYYNVTDNNGITLASSTSTMKGFSWTTINNERVAPYYNDGTGNTTDSYDKNYQQITSSNKDIKFLQVFTKPGSSKTSQIIIVGWKGTSTVGAIADYYIHKTFKDNDLNWLSFDLSSWEGVKTIRLYYGITGGIWVNDVELKLTAAGYVNPYIVGIQVGIGSTTTSISSYGVAAFSSGNYLDFTNVTECSAFYADSYANGVLHLTKATGVVPPHFGLLLSSTDEGAVSFSIPIATAEQAEACTLTTKSNKFVATDESTYTPTTSTEALALGVKNVKDGTAGFYYVGAGVTVPQYRFYLPAPSVGGAKNLTLDFDNATGITSIPFNDPATQNSVGESAIPSQATQPTDLLGRPCPTPRAGALYIKGGKAYLTPAR